MASNSSSDQSETESMAPSSASVSVDFARAATMSMACESDKRPPATAAAYSPREWPATATGDTPTALKTWHKECSTTKSAGWVTVGRENSLSNSSSPAGVLGNSFGRRSMPKRSGAKRSSQASSAAARNNGADVYNPLAIWKYWLPWPGKTKATFGRFGASSKSSNSSTSGKSFCNLSKSCSTSSSNAGTTTAFLKGKVARPVCKV
mmetsp:Transcript_73955/g.213946  ORF Transcript_73955/g.213946 Transcript_73955/m.213946 type:complete len:206 (+) Transcript_73955:496-1113(+)